MMTELVLKWFAFFGSGTLLGCLLWAGLVVAQTGVNDGETTPPTTSAPEENLQGDGEIDYEHAKPMPLPSLPDPVPSETHPGLPSTDETPGPPGYSPGSIGTGQKVP